MKSKTRIIAALLALAMVVGLLGALPIRTQAATTTGTGIAPTSDTYYWVSRVSSSGSRYVHKPPTADGKVMYCLDYGYAYASSSSAFLNSYTYTSATGADADALWAEATAGSGLSEMSVDIQENVKWLMSYIADIDAGEDVGAYFMSVQTYIWENQSNKLAGADDLGDVDGGGYSNPDTYDRYKGFYTQMLEIKAEEDARLQAEVDAYKAQGIDAEIVEDNSQKWAVLATSSKSGRQMFLAYHTARMVVTDAPAPDPTPTPSPEPDPANITFRKVKAGTNTGLDGAVYNIYVDGQIVGSDVTSGGGYIEFTGVVEGLVTFVERVAPAGYALDPTPHSVYVDTSSGQTEYTVTAADDTLPDLVIVKTDAQTGAAISGAVFSVRSVLGGFTSTVTTGAGGTAKLEGLDPGVYMVREESVPEPYVRTGTEQTVALMPGQTVTAAFADYTSPGLELVKLDMLTGAPIGGASFLVEQIDGSYSQSVTTDASGKVFLADVPVGSFRVTETAVPDSYILDTQPQTVALAAGETSTVTFRNLPKPALRILKYDRQTNAPLSGVTFEVYRNATLLGQYTTDGAGEIFLYDLTPGTYLAQEVSTDPAHVVNSTPQQIELMAGDDTRELVFFNSLKPGIHLVKVDSTDPSKVLPNVRFEIRQIGGSYKQEFVTGLDGEIDLSYLDPGAYEVRELAPALTGYLIDDAVRVIQIDPDETANFVFTNTPRPSLKLIKTSSDGTPLPGVTFRIAKIEDGTHYLDRTTNEAGEIVIDNLDPGVYSVKETATDSSHILDLQEYHVELFPGQTSTLAIENQRRPNLIVYKHDADTGEPIANTVFTVTAADGHSVDEIKTDVEGKATLTNLLPGVYEISEKSVPAAWLKDAPDQLVTLYPNRDHTVYFYDHSKPTLTVNKVDSITGEPIQGAKFTVIYGSNSTSTGEINDLGTFYSDENGQFFIDLLRDGWYMISELEPASGYSIKAPDTQEIYIKGGESKEIVFENTPLSALVVWKFDSVTGEAVEGAAFQVRYLGGTSGTGGTVIGTYKTGPNGAFTVTGLQAGAYIIEELASDSTHVIDTAPQTAYISGEEQDVVQLYFGNSPKGAVLIKKIDSATHAPLSDVQFLVTTSEGTVVGNGNGLYTTDSAGTILIDNLDPSLTLVVKEYRAKNGYLLDDTPQTVKVKSGETVTLEFRNQATSSLLIVKKDAVTGEPLSGVQFFVTDSSGGVIGSANGYFTTDSAGTILIDQLTPGMSVIAKETRTRAGYVLDDTPKTAKIKANETVTMEFLNQPQGALIIVKRDSVTGEPLEGVEFKVTTSDGAVVDDKGGQLSSNGIYFSDSEGKIVISPLEPNTYIISELSTIPGYTIHEATRSQTVVVNTNDVQTVYFYNDPTTTLVVHKYIEGTENEPLPGVVFKVTDGNGGAVGPDDGLYTTDKTGAFTVTDLEPNMTVKVQEVKTVEGFILDGTPQDIQIKGGGVQELTFWNARAGTLVVKKLDSVTKKPLAGVEFSITYADGRFVDAANGHLSSNGLYWTDDAGEIRISGISGTVVVSERHSIDGYTINEATRSQTVTIRPQDTQTLYFYNDPIGGVEIVKINEADRTQRLANVTFEIRKMDGGLVSTVTTGSNGRVYVPLDAGDFYAVETEAAKGFRLDPAPHYFTVQSCKTTLLTVTNKPFSGILLHKIDSTTGQGIYGVTFLLYDSSQKPIGQYTSDDRGYVYIEDLTSGRYYLRELKNEGYIVDEQLKTVYVKSGEYTEIVWENTAVTGQIQITKTSADYNSVNGWPAGTPIPNTEFEIYHYRTGNLVDTIRTDKNGVAVSSPLPLGRYKIVESKAADYYGLDKTPIEVEIEYAGQIVRAAMTNKSLYTNVSIRKTGYAEVMPGQTIRYTFDHIGNNSTVSLTSFFWRDTLPVGAVRLSRIVTGTYNADGSYKIVYRTNLSGGEYRTMYDNLSTRQSYTLDASPAALRLAPNEYVTEFMCVFGVVPSGFAQVEAPKVDCTVLSGLSNGVSFTNTADVGGIYNGQWIMAVSYWVTKVYAPAKTLPKTGY